MEVGTEDPQSKSQPRSARELGSLTWAFTALLFLVAGFGVAQLVELPAGSPGGASSVEVRQLIGTQVTAIVDRQGLDGGYEGIVGTVAKIDDRWLVLDDVVRRFREKSSTGGALGRIWIPRENLITIELQ